MFGIQATAGFTRFLQSTAHLTKVIYFTSEAPYMPTNNLFEELGLQNRLCVKKINLSELCPLCLLTKGKNNNQIY